MHIIVAVFLLLAATGLHAYTLETRSSPPDCMDPNSQPERLVNTECASSLTNPSSCKLTRSYTGYCVAYCEQYLYWFFGPEVPFPDSNCEAYETCTFAGAKSVAVTNGYSFEAGLSAKITSKNLEAAFNVGASYTYSITTTTSQILTVTRPGNLTGNCGYWTFLPYYIQSCGFYISGTEHLGPETCMGPYCSSGEMVCSSNYTDIAFGCTNTTYVDSNGDADGVTVFVAKDCATGERLSYVQDIQYNHLKGNIPVLSTGLANTFSSDVAAPDPNDTDTCNRGCICGYSPNKNQTVIIPWPVFPAYLSCQCDHWLSNYLIAIVYGSLLPNSPPPNKIFATAANISLLDHYSVNYTGLVITNSSTDAVPFQRPFECFGNPLTVGTDVFQYVDPEGSFSVLVGGVR